MRVQMAFDYFSRNPMADVAQREDPLTFREPRFYQRRRPSNALAKLSGQVARNEISWSPIDMQDVEDFEKAKKSKELEGSEKTEEVKVAEEAKKSEENAQEMKEPSTSKNDQIKPINDLPHNYIKMGLNEFDWLETVPKKVDKLKINKILESKSGPNDNSDKYRKSLMKIITTELERGW
jgi:hypothetical protein